MDLLETPLEHSMVNPLSGHMSKGMILPEVDFDHIKPRHLGGTWTAKQIGGYAWSMYGLLIFGNVTFYSDLFYRQYVVSKYDRLSLIGQDNMWSAINFFRVLFQYSIWLIAGFFWAATFFSEPWIFIIFHYITYGLVIWELARVFLVIIAQIIAFLYDRFDRTYKLYDHYQDTAGWGNERSSYKEMVDLPWVDI